MNRRRFVGALASVLGTAAIQAYSAEVPEAQEPIGKIKAIAFDGFVVFDPRSVEKRAEELLPGRGAEFTNLWRMRQFEYCWLRTSGG
jgi:2-haloacid dehalogenase